MGPDVIVDDFLIQILSSLIVASIIGAATSFRILNKCVQKQAQDLALMKKATAAVLKMIMEETARIHGDKKMTTDLEGLFKDLTKAEK